jgi:hypothetical protein
MSTFWTVLVYAVVIGGALVLAWALYELSPFARHTDRFRDRAGHKRGESPHLEP